MSHRVFVSFSERSPTEHYFASVLLSRLKQSGITPWLYRQPGQEVPFGEPIREVCRSKIEESQLFLALVYKSCFESEYARFEVESAMAVDRLIRVPVIGKSIPKGWPGPYQLLEAEGTMGVYVDFSDRFDVEKVVMKVCAHLGEPHVGAVILDHRVPLTLKLYEELHEKAGPGSGFHEQGPFLQAFDFALEAENARQRWKESGRERSFERQLKTAIEALDSFLRLHYGRKGISFLYPRLVRGVVAFELSTSLEEITDAQRIFEELIASGEVEPDENCFVALATVQLAREDFSAALASYRAAWNVAAREETDIAFGLIRAAVLAGETPDAAAVAMVRAPAFLERYQNRPEELPRAEALRAFVAALSAELLDVERTVRRLCGNPFTPVDLIIELAQLCRTVGVARADRRFALAARECLRLLAESGAVADTGQLREVRHRLARLDLELGDYRSALRLLESLQSESPRYPQYCVELAICHLALNDSESARVFAETARSCRRSDQCEPRPDDASFSYWRGFAEWIVARREDATRDFEDSDYSPEAFYPDVLRGLGISAYCDAIQAPAVPGTPRSSP